MLERITASLSSLAPAEQRVAKLVLTDPRAFARLPSSTGIEGDGNVPAYVQALLEQTVEGLDRMQRSALDSERERRTTADHLAELNTQLGRLAELVGRESRDLSAL